MSNILVAIDGSESNAHLLEVAIERAEREDGSLIVAHVTPEADYQSKRRAIGSSRDLRRDGFTFTLPQARDAAERVAERAARAAIGNRDVPYVAVGAVGRLVPSLEDIASNYDCATILLGEEPSWWRRRFGGVDRELNTHFDGTVVRVPLPAPSTSPRGSRRSEQERPEEDSDAVGSDILSGQTGTSGGRLPR